jgi:hypothetical protein
MIITPALLAHIDALPAADGSLLAEATRDALDPFIPMTGMELEEATITGVALALLWQGQATISPEHKALLLTAYAEHGYDAPEGATDADLLAIMDAITAAPPYSVAMDKRIAYGVMLALQADRPEVAMTLADTPDGAGIGWSITRQDLGAPVAA